MNMIEIDRAICSCQDCELYKQIDHKVLGHGNVKSDIVFIGENPRPNEYIEWTPFVSNGKAGNRYNKALSKVGFIRPDIYTTNACKCWRWELNTKGNKVNVNPDKKHVEACMKHLWKELDFIKPRIIVAMGNNAMIALFGDKKWRITKIHGQVFDLEKDTFKAKVIPIYHPSYMDYKRDPKTMEEFEADFSKIRQLWEVM